MTGGRKGSGRSSAAAHAQALADAAAGDAAPPISGMRAARQAVVDAQDEVEAAKGALAQLKGTLPDYEAELREAEIAVEAAISAILAEASKKADRESHLDCARTLAAAQSAARVRYERSPAKGQ